MKKSAFVLKKTGFLLALLGALALSACGTPDTDSDRNSIAGNGEKVPNSSNSNKEAKDKTLDSSLFEYTLIEEENTVLLTKYIGEAAQVTVYGSYKIGGKEYKTRLQDGIINNSKSSPFWDNTTITSVTFVGGVKLNNCGSFFSGCTKLETVDLSGLDTSECSKFSAMFCDCSSLQAIDLSTLNMDKLTDLYSMFSYCESLTELDLSMIDTSNVTSFSNLFEHCSSLETLNIEGMNTSKSLGFVSMFDGCRSLASIDVSGFDTAGATALSAMFRGCESLTSIDCSSFDTSNITYLESMFAGCASLTTLNIDSFDTRQVQSMASMFEGCRSLEQLDISHFTAGGSLKYIYNMFKNCEKLTAVYVNQGFYDRAYSDKMKNNSHLFEESAVSDFTVK